MYDICLLLSFSPKSLYVEMSSVVARRGGGKIEVIPKNLEREKVF